MRRRVYLGQAFFWPLLLLLCQTAAGQTVDSTYIITNTDKPYGTIPVTRSGKSFFDMLNPFKDGVRPTILYSSDDRVFAGINYNRHSGNWVPDSLGSRHRAFVHYSFNQHAYSLGYQAIFHRLVGHWNLFLESGFDWVKWINFSGLGNESAAQVGDQDFFRIRNREAIVSAAFQHRIGKQSSITVTPFYQFVRLLRDEDRFLSKAASADARLDNFDPNHFGGLRAELQLQHLNDLLLPTKGSIFSVGVARVQNVGRGRGFTNYNAYSRLYFPFLRHFVLSVENGAATLSGRPEFYQLNSIGGNSLRGFRRNRFWGETVFHNNNELHYLFNAPAKLFSGKMGLMVFGDQGRVWKSGERSSAWHYGYGGGVILVPYRKVFVSMQYGISRERKGFNMELRRAL